MVSRDLPPPDMASLLWVHMGAGSALSQQPNPSPAQQWS